MKSHNQETSKRAMKDAEEVAASVRRHITANDRLVTLFGMEVEEASAGSARVSMTVDERHLNAAGLCHGAAMFALADVAFALAANCHGKMALALECSVNYFRPVKPGSTITATAEEVFSGRRTGSFLVRITDQDERLVCLFKSTSFRMEDDRSVLNTRLKETAAMVREGADK